MTAGCWHGSTASDLLVAECLRTGAWAELKPAELAAVISAVLYESRGGDGPSAPFAAEAPTPRLRQALLQTAKLSYALRADEQTHRITPSREPDDGFVTAIYRWARSGDLAGSLAAADVTGSGSPLLAGISYGGAGRCSICWIRSATQRPKPNCGRRQSAPSTMFGAASSQLTPGRLGASYRYRASTQGD